MSNHQGNFGISVLNVESLSVLAVAGIFVDQTDFDFAPPPPPPPVGGDINRRFPGFDNKRKFAIHTGIRKFPST